jgi:hypothetical protein
MKSNASPPFASADGKPVNPSGGASGGHDFVTDPKSHSPATGGRDFTKESRAQPAVAESQDQTIAPESIPAGGRILKADPMPVSKMVSGTAEGPGQRTPFKGLK